MTLLLLDDYEVMEAYMTKFVVIFGVRKHGFWHNAKSIYYLPICYFKNNNPQNDFNLGINST
jgi:hypothetical protein